MNFIKEYIRDVPDFPVKGIIFKDITPLLNNAGAFSRTIEAFEKSLAGKKINRIVGIESRGFILGAPLAAKIGAGFVPARKAGKLPHETIKETFTLEYGEDALEIHRDSIKAGESVVIVDDLLATGGTMKAAINLVNTTGGKIEKILFLIELSFLDGRAQMEIDGRPLPFEALISY